MLATFIDKALALLDRRFLVGYWMPAFLFGLILFFTAGWSLPWLGLTAEDYFALEGLRLSGITLGLLFLVTVFAYLLRAFTRPIIRTYEGYWPWRRLQTWGIRRQQKRLRHLRDMQLQAFHEKDRRRYSRLQILFYRDYPSQAHRILPTRLGNVLRAAEDYSMSRYGLEGVFWWPRLEPLLPESLLTRLEAAFVGLIALLNLATLSLLYALLLLANLFLYWGGYVTINNDFDEWWLWPLVATIALVIAYVIYRGAVTQARAYGDLIRVAYDEHRFLILDALHIEQPRTPREEHLLWSKLYKWLYQQDLGSARWLLYKKDEKKAEG